MKATISNTTRRHFLKAFGGSLLAIPFFSGLASRMLQAEEGVEAPRFVMIFTGNNQFPSHWMPTASGPLELGPVHQPFNALKEKLLLLNGLKGVSGHSGGMSETTTNQPSKNGDGVAVGGPSIDQYFAILWKAQTPLRSLELGVNAGNSPNDQIIYSSSGLPIPAIGSPVGAFNKVFNLTNEDPRVAAGKRKREASVLDIIAKDLTSAQRGLGPRTRVLLDEHLTHLREREKELKRPYMPLMCNLPESPEEAQDRITRIWRGHNKTIFAALRCGTTRVVSLRVGGWGGADGYDDIGLPSGHHNVAHRGTADPDGDLLGINLFHAQNIADLATQMEAFPCGNGSLLDNTILVWFNELGLGVETHQRTNLPVFIAGGSALGFANGKHVDFKGVSHQHLIYTLARQLGEKELKSFGEEGDQILTRMLRS